jgi:hypothetical protein
MVRWERETQRATAAHQFRLSVFISTASWHRTDAMIDLLTATTEPPPHELLPIFCLPWEIHLQYYKS